MEPIKSIAVPVTRKRGSGKPRRAGHPAALPDNHVTGAVGPVHKRRVPVVPAPHHLYRIGQQLLMLSGGRHWARPGGSCRVTALLPYEGATLLYRVRSDEEGFERVVAEADLSPVP